MTDDEMWTLMFLSWMAGCILFRALAALYVAVFE